MTRLNERMRPEGKKTKQKHLHSWRISLGEKKNSKHFMLSSFLSLNQLLRKDRRLVIWEVWAGL